MSVNMSSVLKSHASKYQFSKVIPGESSDALWVQSLNINVWEMSYDKY